jgi:hypothetical protein
MVLDGARHMMTRTNSQLLIVAPAHAAVVGSYPNTTCALEGSRGDATVLAERLMR